MIDRLMSILESCPEAEDLDQPPHFRGWKRQRERLTLVADVCAQRYPGDLLEIGAYVGETTVMLADIARHYGRRVMVVDPWQPGTQNCQGGEYDKFLRNTQVHADIIDVVRLPSEHPEAVATMQKHDLCFVFIDGLHTYRACLSDIKAVAHTRGIIALDDVRWNEGLQRAYAEGTEVTGFVPVRYEFIREAYLVSGDVPFGE